MQIILKCPVFLWSMDGGKAVGGADGGGQAQVDGARQQLLTARYMKFFSDDFLGVLGS